MAAPSKNFTIIADSAIDADSPLTAGLMEDFRDNDIHLEEWLGLSYTAEQNHDHDGVNSSLISELIVAETYELTTTAGAGWSVSTGALGFDPVVVIINWMYDNSASTDVMVGWGFAHNIGTTQQNGMSVTWDTGATVVTDWVIDSSSIMGFDRAGGGAFATAFTEYARVTQMGTGNVTITTQTGTWGGNNVYINMIVIGQPT